MGLAEFCIRRPVFATVLSLLLVLIGAVAFERLSVREYPNIDESVVSVSTTYPGASAEIIETQVTQILEGSLAGIEGIDILESSSRAESSRITIRFRLSVNPDVAASDVRDRVGRVRQRLPDEIDEPVIAKVEADAQPIMLLVFRDAGKNALQITDYVDRFVLDRFKNVPGVADVTIFGERRYAMRVWVDRERLAAYGLTVQDIETALRGQNVEIPAGRVESTDREFTVLSQTGLKTPAEFGAIVLKIADGYQVRLADVARVELGPRDERRESRFEGASAIAVGVIKQAVANPLDVSNGVNGILPAVRQTLPEGMTIGIGYDNAVFIDRSITAVYTTIAEAIALVVLVILVFLRSLRASIIPVVTIPVSLIATFAIMYACGFTINTLSLLAIVLAIGLVVDDAIVVLENVYRYVEEGMAPVDAAIKGTREIGFAVIAMTLTLAAVYAPVAFAEGRTGRLFTEFALTLAGAVVISGFVALTLTPMMCAKLLRHEARPLWIFRVIGRALDGLDRLYRAVLVGALHLRLLVLAVAIGVAASNVWLFQGLKQELAPVEDRGLVVIRGTAPEGATLGYTTRYATQLEELLKPYGEVATILTIVGNPEVTNFFIRARLKDWGERTVSQQQIVAELAPRLRREPGVQANATNQASFGERGGGRPIEFVLQTSGTYEMLQEEADKLVAAIAESPVLTAVDTDLKLNKPELTLDLDRAKVADLRLDVATAGRTLETLLGGRQVTRFDQNGEQYDVVVQLATSDRQSPETLSTIYLRAPDGTLVQLSNIVTVRETVAPRELKRFNQLRAVTISANLNAGYALGDGLRVVQEAAQRVLAPTTQTELAGQSREFRSTNDSLLVVFGLALAFIYLVLAAQFESFRDPLIILVSVPLSIAGALLTLTLVGGTINVYSQIGLITLIGLITKHGILIVEFANQRQLAGVPRRDAIVEAAAQRLRPILMTTGAMVLGAIPLALSTGAGAESRQQIGWVIVGGMTAGTLLTLFIVPALYSYLGRTTRDAAQPAGAAQPTG